MGDGTSKLKVVERTPAPPGPADPRRLTPAGIETVRPQVSQPTAPFAPVNPSGGGRRA